MTDFAEWKQEAKELAQLLKEVEIENATIKEQIKNLKQQMEDRLKDKDEVIKTLKDHVHYVGQTNSLHVRLKQHLSDRENNKKASWIRELKKLGLTPSIKLLEKVSPEEANTAELKWIQHYSKTGFLKNTMRIDPEQRVVEMLRRESSSLKRNLEFWRELCDKKQITADYFRLYSEGLKEDLKKEHSKNQELPYKLGEMKALIADKDKYLAYYRDLLEAEKLKNEPKQKEYVKF
jgi:hypothetical protein